MIGYNKKPEIRKLYDVISPYYQALWGEHIHHGYWVRGDESKEIAQVQLVEHLAQTAGLKKGCKILDVGCGIGAGSIYLASTYTADVTGITISPIQLDMATRTLEMNPLNKGRVRFLLMDAEALLLEERFDALWAVESISHFQDVAAFFASAASLLTPGGKIALIDWFKREGLNARETRRFVVPIEQSMLVNLRTMPDYSRWMHSNGLSISHNQVLNQYCARTWEISLDFVKDRSFWELAAKHGSQFVRHLKGLRAMRAGFASGNFVYGLMVAQKR